MKIAAIADISTLYASLTKKTLPKMNFANPFIEVYFRPQTLKSENDIPFYKEVCWIFLKNIDNRLKLYQHRINIEISETAPRNNTMKFGSIYGYILKLDKSFNETIDSERRRKFLDLIHDALNILGTENNWDLAVVEDAYKKSLGQLDKFEYLTKKKMNRSKHKSGQIELTLKGNWLSFHVHIFNLETSQKEKIKLFDTSEDNLSWNRMFKEFGWYDNSRFGLKFLKGDLWIVINIENGQVEELINPNKFDLKKISKYLEELKKPAYNN